MDDDVKRAQKCARAYRDMGLSPLPSRTDDKRPALSSFSQYQSQPLEHRHFNDWGTPNIQLMTGAKAYGKKKIVVVDCDGDQAESKFRYICGRQACDISGTWCVLTGGGGTHFYFSLPPTRMSCKSGRIWGVWDTFGDEGVGEWEHHTEIRILGDGALAVAPPSAHVENWLCNYEFIKETKPPKGKLLTAPAWLLDMPRISDSPFAKEKAAFALRSFTDRNEILAAIPYKLPLAKSWGLKVASGPNEQGWASCHAVGREDRNPSASFHVETGMYQDRKDMKTVSLFDLGVMLGRFQDWRQCSDWCSDTYIRRS